MIDPPPAAYGTTRQRGTDLSHAEIERAALAILTGGARPTVASLRTQLGRGSPATIASSLKRFWRDLASRAQGDPVALAQLPSDVADLAESLWQRALNLASQSAKREDNAARERLERIRIENELRAQSFASREKEFETSARERERALADSRDHLLSTLRMLESDRATLRAKDRRIAELEAQIEDYRRQLTTLIERAVSRNRALGLSKPRTATSRKPKPLPRSSSGTKDTRRTDKSKRRAKKK